MKIAIVCGHFIPDMGYIEVHLAKAFAKSGHQVQVITSTAIPSYVKHLYSDYGPAPKGVGITRLKPVFELGQIVVSRGIRAALQENSPDLIVVIGLGKRFPKPVFATGIPTVTLFGDNAHSYVSNSVKAKLKTQLLFRIFKRATYRLAIDKSAKLIAYTPESFQAAAEMVGGHWKRKLLEQNSHISLGFWPEEFNQDSEKRSLLRKELSWDDDKFVCITATRVKPEKELESALNIFESLPKNFVWLILGSGEDAYAKQLMKEAETRIGKGRVKMLPHQDRNVLNGFYNAADAALYTVPAISIFEAVGTGLPVFCPPIKSVSHINGKGVEVYSTQLSSDDLVKIFLEIDTSELARVNRAKAAERRFSWEQIALAVLQATEKKGDA